MPASDPNSSPEKPTAAKKAPSSLATKILKAVLSPIIFIAVLELGARLIGLQSSGGMVPNEFNCLQRSSLLLLEFQPHCTGKQSATDIRTNELGLRGSDLRHDGSQLILTLGDSCTWGWKVKQNESYPEVLQQLLDSRTDGQRYQVINAGTPGYTSHQGLLLFRERLLKLNPEIVIIGYGFNDSTPIGDVEVQLERTRRLMPVIQVDDFLLRNSRLYRWGRWRGNQQVTAAEELPARVSPEKYKKNLMDMISLAREHGAKVMMISFSQPGVRQDAYLAEMRDVAAEMSVPLIKYQGPRLDVVHPNAEGYRTLATTVLERLEQAGYVH